MIEVELKYRLHDLDELLAGLLARGAVARGESMERDLYFAHPQRDFATTNEALRLRWDGTHATMTYKGPLLDATSKSREEREVPLADEAAVREAETLLSRLGFVPVRTVEKRRIKWSLCHEAQDVTITIDEVVGLEPYVELETLADEDAWKQARETLNALANKLGLEHSERRSYLELLMKNDP